MIGQMALRGQERSSFHDCYCVMTVSVHSEDFVFLVLMDLISAHVTLAVLLYLTQCVVPMAVTMETIVKCRKQLVKPTSP